MLAVIAWADLRRGQRRELGPDERDDARDHRARRAGAVELGIVAGRTGRGDASPGRGDLNVTDWWLVNGALTKCRSKAPTAMTPG